MSGPLTLKMIRLTKRRGLKKGRMMKRPWAEPMLEGPQDQASPTQNTSAHSGRWRRGKERCRERVQEENDIVGKELNNEVRSLGLVGVPKNLKK